MSNFFANKLDKSIILDYNKKNMLSLLLLLIGITFQTPTDTIRVGKSHTLEQSLPSKKSKVVVYLYHHNSVGHTLLRRSVFRRIKTEIKIKTQFNTEGKYVYVIRVVSRRGINQYERNVTVLK